VHILIVTQYFWPENFRINDLTEGLLEKGHKVTVLTGIPNYPAGSFFLEYGLFSNLRQVFKGAKVIRVPLIPRGNGSGLRLALNYFSFALFASVLAPFLCRGKYDVIFVFEPSPITVGLPALVLKKWKSIPVLFWVQDLWPESLTATGAVHSPWIINKVRALVGFIYRGCDRILVTSQAYYPPVQSFGIDSKTLRYFPQSVEAVYQPVKVEVDASEDALMLKGFRVMFAGNLGAAQSFGTILDAAEKLKSTPGIKIIIVGDGRMRSWIEEEVGKRGLGETVQLLGRYPLEAMPRFFALADALLVTLKREPIFALTIPGKIQSYFACGKPVIAALDGEGSRLIDEAKAGITCPAEDADALAKAILAMAKMPREGRVAMGESALNYYHENFNRDLLIARLEKWMLELSGGNLEGLSLQ
jgi:glycosyltransferase involved in cell wall biosynthesis